MTIKKASKKEFLQTAASGDILICSGDYMMSKLIQTFTDSPFNHVGFIWVPEPGRALVFEAMWDELKITPLEHYLENYENSGSGYEGILYLGRYQPPPDTEQELKPMLDYALATIGREYDKESLLKIGLTKLFRISTENDNDKEMICSEYVGNIFKKLYVELNKDNDGFVTPGSIARDGNIELICKTEY